MNHPTLEPTIEQEIIKPPSMWKVVFHNDDFTPMTLVVSLLVQVFNKNLEEAERITLSVHEHGKGVAGLYTKEVAETKQAVATAAARKYESPLMITVESIH